MPTKTLLALGMIFLCLHSHAQTKLIAHKSHSGRSDNFIAALENDWPGIAESNFGMAPDPTVYTAKLDSVIYIGDSTAVMVTSNYCSNPRRNKTGLWRAGRDTVHKHYLFSKRHALDSIKQVLTLQFYFKNNMDSTIFIGYDNGFNCTDYSDSLQFRVTPLHIPTDNTPTTPNPFWLGITTVAALLVAWMRTRRQFTRNIA